MGGGISSYFTSLEFPENCWVGGRCRFLHLCPSLWHKLWCQFGVATYDVSIDLHGGPLIVPMWSWLWRLTVLLLFWPDLRRWVVRHRQSKRWKLSLPPGRGSCGPRCDGPSQGPLLCIVVHVEAWRVRCWCSHHFFLEGPLVASGIGAGRCREIPARLGPCGSGREAIYWASDPHDLLAPLLSVCPQWIMTWLTHIELHMYLPCAFWRTSGLMSWTHFWIVGQRPLYPVWPPLHERCWPWRWCGSVALLSWAGEFLVLTY